MRNEDLIGFAQNEGHVTTYVTDMIFHFSTTVRYSTGSRIDSYYHAVLTVVLGTLVLGTDHNSPTTLKVTVCMGETNTDPSITTPPSRSGPTNRNEALIRRATGIKTQGVHPVFPPRNHILTSQI
jgi:hypothetical protein